MATVKWTTHAMERMREQARYIAQQSCSAEIAWRWANDIFTEADSLADFPNIGHRLPEFPETPYKEILVRKNFRLIYRLSGDVCYIITIRRCSMLLNETVMSELDSVT